MLRGYVSQRTVAIEDVDADVAVRVEELDGITRHVVVSGQKLSLSGIGRCLSFNFSLGFLLGLIPSLIAVHGVRVELRQGGTLRVGAGASSRLYRLHWIPSSHAYEQDALRVQIQTQWKMKLESGQFRLQKALLDKQLHQVFHRKTEEASVATKQLRRRLESRKALLLKRGGKNGNNTATQLMQEIDHEAEVTDQLNELCAVYERQIEEMAEEAEKLKDEVEALQQEKSRMAEEAEKLKDEVEALQQEKSRCSCQEKEVDSFEKDLDITDLSDLEAQVVSVSSMVEQLRLHKAELDHGKSQDVRSQHTASVGSGYKLVDDISPSASENSTVVTSETASPVCCSYSKNSLCETMKCKCRSKGGSCGASCGCAVSKCSNRKAVPIKSSDSPLSEISNGVLNSSNTSETVKSSIEASEGAMLLQSTLVQKAAEPEGNFGARKKPLTEIGNILVSTNAAKPGPQKREKASESACYCRPNFLSTSKYGRPKGSRRK
ncbi:kinesin-like protein KIN-4C isoform X2 [Rosa rugosa]|uniref:kinesin-like protein KIN-4C isoform X2 n=1 Tax=Rosa rugosa TaxID=74645 RepID=UPI002B403EB8|nr:kinesin-like protein KIN-4C isoform X2 [Rosa rugosa]